jgi:ribulose-phosphate 3-epimerase
MAHIYPSLMGADQLNLEKVIDLLQPYCAGFHLDILDNHFAPNISWGAGTVNAIAKKVGKGTWVHLMVERPEEFYETLLLPAGSLVSFHIETNIDVFGFIKRIKEKKHRAGIVINPKTPANRVVPFLNVIDQVLVMSVEPGFSGQPFLPEVVQKIDELAAHRLNGGFHFSIGMDGGIAKTNIAILAQRGVDDFAIAGGIFNTSDSVQALQELHMLIENYKKE